MLPNPVLPSKLFNFTRPYVVKPDRLPGRPNRNLQQCILQFLKVESLRTIAWPGPLQRRISVHDFWPFRPLDRLNYFYALCFSPPCFAALRTCVLPLSVLLLQLCSPSIYFYSPLTMLKRMDPEQVLQRAREKGSGQNNFHINSSEARRHLKPKTRRAY